MFEQYSLVEQIAIGTYQYTRSDNTMDPPQFCSHFYRRGTIFAFNESFIFDPTIDHGMLLLYAHHLLIKHVRIMNLFTVLQHCWLTIRESIWSLKLSNNFMAMACYLSRASCKWKGYAYSRLIHTMLSGHLIVISCLIEKQNSLPFWCWLSQVVLENRPLNECFVYNGS